MSWGKWFLPRQTSFFSAFLLTPSISLHIRQAHHMDGDTVNNTHNDRGGWTGHKQLHRGEGKEEERKVNQREKEAGGKKKRVQIAGSYKKRKRNRQTQQDKKRKQRLTWWGPDKWEVRGEGSVVAEMFWEIMGEKGKRSASSTEYDKSSVGVVRKFTAKVWIFMTYLKVNCHQQTLASLH